MMLSNTKIFIDGIFNSVHGSVMKRLCVAAGVEPQFVANELADGISLEDMLSGKGPFTREEEFIIADDLRSGSANKYLAGLLGYV